MQEIAFARRRLLLAHVVTWIAFAAVAGGMAFMVTHDVSPPAILFLLTNLVIWGVMIFQATAAHRLARIMGAGSPLAWAAGTFIMPLGWVLVLVLSSRAATALRRRGVAVGFLGPRLP
ncbi:MAG TPA: hypothetical protein VLS93_16060 [Anaeromyxobacteraceae bacterium]|nr:hypothetical protein [Anaeromyxobacteraceae bacterium]